MNKQRRKQRKLVPTITGIGCPLKLYPLAANRIIDRFKETGEWVSPSGGTLWVVLQWCHENKKSYTLKRFSEFGYWVIRDHEKRRRRASKDLVPPVWKAR